MYLAQDYGWLSRGGLRMRARDRKNFMGASRETAGARFLTREVFRNPGDEPEDRRRRPKGLQRGKADPKKGLPESDKHASDTSPPLHCGQAPASRASGIPGNANYSF